MCKRGVCGVLWCVVGGVCCGDVWCAVVMCGVWLGVVGCGGVGCGVRCLGEGGGAVCGV